MMGVAAFDRAAATYDADFTDSRVGRAQRNLVWAHLTPVLGALGRPAEVLEINCGTGEDAVHLAKAGYNVMATDISAAMIAETNRKAAAAGVGERLRTAQLSAQMLSADRFKQQFDMVLSNFGGLNCLDPDEMVSLARQLAGLVRPGGRVILVIMPHLCLWEVAWNLPRLRPSAAFRRWGTDPVPAKVGDATFPIWYYGPDEIRSLFEAEFDCLTVRPVGLAVPPSALETVFADRPRTVDCLEKIDRALPAWPCLAAAADHMLLDLRRRG